MARGRGKSSGKAGTDKDKDKKVDACAVGAAKCERPDDKRVDWVYCEGCSSWFHCPCVKIDGKRASDPDFIFHCEICAPLKIQEFNESKDDLIEKIGEVIKEHPIFATAKLPQKCFSTKSKGNEYHSGKGGIPLTLRDLNHVIARDIITIDYLKYQVKAMGDRLNTFLKPELIFEAKILTKKLLKVANEKSNSAKGPIAKSAKPAPVQTPQIGRRGRSGQQQTEGNDSNKENKEGVSEKEGAEPEILKGRRGKKQKSAGTKDSPDNEDLDKLSLELTRDVVPTPEPQEEKKEIPKKGRGRGRVRGKENELKEEKDAAFSTDKPPIDEKVGKAAVPNANNKEAKPIDSKDMKQIPNATTNPPAKDSSKVTSAIPGGRGKRKAPAKSKEDEVATMDAKKVKGGEDIAKTLAEKNPIRNKKVSRRQNKKADPMISTLSNITKVGVSLLGRMPQLPTTPLPISVKKTVLGGLSPTKIAMPIVQPGRVVNIASLLPTSPNPRMQNTTQIRPGTQQLIQIRPGNVQIQSQGPSLTGSNLVQLRPPNQVLNAIGNATLRPHQLQAGGIGSTGSIIGAPGGPQFFKIVGGKPIQLSGTTSASLTNSTTTKMTVPTISGPSSQPGHGPRIVYVRKGPGGSAIPVGGSSLPITTTPITSPSSGQSVSTSPSKLQNKIILVSNKNQIPGVSVGGKGQSLNTPHGLVKLVGSPAGSMGIPGSTPLAPGILSSLRPVAVTASGSSPKTSGSGPVLLRTVMPKPQASVFQKTVQSTPSIIGVVPQLPNVPIPKSKLNDKTTTTSTSASRMRTTVASTATSVEQLLPKRPIPPQKVSIGGTGPPPPKIFKRVISGPIHRSGLIGQTGNLALPSNVIPSTANTQLSLKQPTQQVTTISGPFVWKNSSQTNFKLSSRINFASFAKFKESTLAAEAAAAAAAGTNKKDSTKKNKGKNAGDSLANNEEIHFTLATIVTDDKSNEFTFRLNLKNDPKDPKGTTTFLELEARSKKPHNDHKWNLKVKTVPERYLVSGGCFKTDDNVSAGSSGKTKNAPNKTTDACAFRIPKEISDLKFVDYELQIDKVLILQQPQSTLSTTSPSKAVIITSSANRVSTTKKAIAASK